MKRVLLFVASIFVSCAAFAQTTPPPAEATAAQTAAGTSGQVYISPRRLATALEGVGSGPGGGAPTSAKYIVQTPNGSLTSEQALSLLATGLLKNTTGTGALSIAVAGTDFVAPANNLSEFTATASTVRTNLGTAAKSQAFVKIGGIGIDNGVVAVPTATSRGFPVEQAFTLSKLRLFTQGGSGTISVSITKNGSVISAAPIALTTGTELIVTDFSGWGSTTFIVGDRVGWVTTGTPTATEFGLTVLGTATLN